MDEEHAPFDGNAMFAWANLVGAIVDTLESARVPNALIHQFLDRIDDANAQSLRGSAREAYARTIAAHRESIASND